MQDQIFEAINEARAVAGENDSATLDRIYAIVAAYLTTVKHSERESLVANLLKQTESSWVSTLSGYSQLEHDIVRDSNVIGYLAASEEKQSSDDQSDDGSILSWKVMALSIGIVVMLILLIPVAMEESDDLDQNHPEVFMAKESCMLFVKRRLKSPATAKFERYSIAVIPRSRRIYHVGGVVDSQNGFGAMIRSEWFCQTQFLGGDVYSQSNWRNIDLVIN